MKRAFLTLAIMVFASTAYGGALSGLTDFTSGTTAQSSQVNANFASVETEVTDNDTRIDTHVVALADEAGLESSVGSLNILLNTEIDTTAELLAIITDEGAAGTYLNANGTWATPAGTSAFTDGTSYIHPTVSTKDLANDNAASNWSIMDTGAATFTSVTTPDAPGSNGIILDDNLIGTMPAAPAAGRVGIYAADNGELYKKDSSDGATLIRMLTSQGMTGCNLITDKVLYTSATGLFSCGTDQTGTGVALNVAGTAALGTALIASDACATLVTVAATGALATDIITFTPNADIEIVTGYTSATTGGLSIYPYPTAGNVNFKVCNPTASSITPGAVTLNWRVAR